MKKLISFMMAITMVLTLFTFSAFAESSFDGDFEISVQDGDTKVVISWEEFNNADYFVININSDIDYYCVSEKVYGTSYDWVPDSYVTPNDYFDITVTAYDKNDELLATSTTAQVYIVVTFCDYFGYYGDVDSDQEPSVIDATIIQKHLVNSYDFNEMQKLIADVDSDSKLTIMDATFIQQFCAGISHPDNRTYYSFSLGWVEYNVIPIDWM